MDREQWIEVAQNAFDKRDDSETVAGLMHHINELQDGAEKDAKIEEFELGGLLNGLDYGFNIARDISPLPKIITEYLVGFVEQAIIGYIKNKYEITT